MRTTVGQIRLNKETAYAIGCFVGMQKLAQDPDPAWLDQTIKDIEAGGKKFRPRKHLRNVYLGGHKRNIGYRPIGKVEHSEVDELRKFVRTLITSDDNAVARLPSGRTFFAGGASSGRHDMSFRPLRTTLLGEARPERAYAIAEKLPKDPLLGKRIEEAIAGKRPIESIRMPRGTTVPQRGAVTYFHSELKKDPTVIPHIKERLVNYLRSGRIDDPAKLIKDVGYTQPSNVQSILRRVYNRRDIYDYMRQSGFPRLKSLSAAILKKDRRLAAILGSLTALTGGSYAGYRALQKEPTPVVPDDQKKKKQAPVDAPKRDSTPSIVAKDDRKKTP
jgi:hypothetical protein